MHIFKATTIKLLLLLRNPRKGCRHAPLQPRIFILLLALFRARRALSDACAPAYRDGWREEAVNVCRSSRILRPKYHFLVVCVRHRCFISAIEPISGLKWNFHFSPPTTGPSFTPASNSGELVKNMSHLRVSHHIFATTSSPCFLFKILSSLISKTCYCDRCTYKNQD